MGARGDAQNWTWTMSNSTAFSTSPRYASGNGHCNRRRQPRARRCVMQEYRPGELRRSGCGSARNSRTDGPALTTYFLLAPAKCVRSCVTNAA
jgi:hypothetical protein